MSGVVEIFHTLRLGAGTQIQLTKGEHLKGLQSVKMAGVPPAYQERKMLSIN